MAERKKIGEIGVDAGLCWIGDPCYILHREGRNPEAIGKDWGDFCNKLHDSDSDEPLAYQMNYDMGHEGLGVVVSTGYGNGCYPVYAEYKDGRIASVTVEFIGEEDEGEDW